MSTSPESEAWNGSGRGNWGLGCGKESGGNCGSGSGPGVGGSGSGPGVGGAGLGSGGLRGVGVLGLGVWGLRGAAGSGLRGVGVWGLGVSGLGVWGWRGAGDSGRGSGSARGGASSQDDDVCEAIHAPVGGVSAEGDDDGDGGPIGGVSGDACPRRAEAGRRVGTSRVEREDERGSGVGEEGGVCAAGAAGRCAG